MNKIKVALIGFPFLTLATTHTVAQQIDSIKVVLPPKPVQQFADSLRRSEHGIKFSPVTPGRTDFERHSYSFSDHKMNFKSDKHRKRTTIFNYPYSKFIIPSALISYGLLTQKHDWFQEIDQNTHHEVSRHFTKRIHLDDYTQFAPSVAVYGLDLMGIKAKHNFRDRTFVMATSYLLMSAGVQTLKRTTKIERPDGSNFHSFPSGHTATAFVGAHILFKEYKDTSFWIGVAGYAVASGTGIMRVYNKKHWVSDIVSGAGIGILSVEASYLLLPVFHKILGIKDSQKSFVIAPAIGRDNYGVGLAYTF